MKIQSINTNFLGYKFRSRLEARYAAFFTSLDLEWEYEKEGFTWDSRDGEKYSYLPDFYFPNGRVYVEIKGVKDVVDGLAENELKRLSSFVDQVRRPLVIMPDIHKGTYFAVLRPNESTAQSCSVDESLFPPIVWSDYRGVGMQIAYHTPERIHALMCTGPDCSLSMNCVFIGCVRDQSSFVSVHVIEALKYAREIRFEHGETPSRQDIKQYDDLYQDFGF